AATRPGGHRLAARDLGLEYARSLGAAARGGSRAWKQGLRSDRRRAARIDTAHENALDPAAELAPRDEPGPARVRDDFRAGGRSARGDRGGSAGREPAVHDDVADAIPRPEHRPVRTT